MIRVVHTAFGLWRIARPLIATVGSLAFLVGLSSHAGAADGSETIVRHGVFVFHVAEDDRRLVRALARVADPAWERITGDLGTRPPGPVTVVLAANDGAFNRFQPPGQPLPDWASGVAYPRAMAMVIRSYHVPGAPRQDVGTIFVHELTHLILGARFGHRPVPRWLHEGLAMYEAGQWRPGDEWRLVWAVLGNGIPSFEALTRSFGRTEADARLAYLFSQALVNHMIAFYGREPFAAFVGLLADGRTFDEALIDGLRVAPSRFDQRWRAHLDRRYTWIPVVTSTSAVWALLILVAVAAYVVRRRRNRRVMARWEEEDRRMGPPTDPSS